MPDKGFDQGERREPVAPRLSHPLAGASVLIVEDEFLVGFDLQDFLEGKGAKVVGPASTVEQALELIDSEPVSCAILDIRVRGENVFPVATRLSEKNIPFLFHTGHGDSGALDKEWPGCAVLIKPVQYDRLLDSLQMMLVTALDSVRSPATPRSPPSPTLPASPQPPRHARSAG